jgi:hypothetical protein
MDRISKRLYRRLYRLKQRNTPITRDERNNLINSIGLYKLVSNRSKSVDRIIQELLNG